MNSNTNLLIHELKKINRSYFWNLNSKRKFFYFLLKIPFINHFLKSLIPYEFKEIENKINRLNEKVLVYTCLFGNFDNLIDPLFFPDNVDYYLITDQVESYKDSKWKIFTHDILQTTFFKNLSNVEKNRYIKINPHLFFPDYNISIYIDSNIVLLTDPNEFVSSFNDLGVKIHNHYRVKCAYKEIKRCIKLKKDKISNLKKIKNIFLTSKFPKNYGMLEASVIARMHNNEKCKQIMEKWWFYFFNYSKRDQISLPFVLWSMKIKVNSVSTLGNDLYSNYGILKLNHKSLHSK